MNRATDARWIGLCVAAYVVLGVLHASSWEHQHDEGLTIDGAVGSLELEPWPAEPTPVEELYGLIDGSAARSPAQVLEELGRAGRMPHPPAWYLLVNAWSRIGGTGALGARVPALLLGVLAVLGFFRLAQRLLPGASAARWATLLFALSPWTHTLASFLRPYGLAVCLFLWSTVVLLRLIGSDTPGRATDPRRLLYVVLAALGLYTLYQFVFVIAWHALLMAVHAWRADPPRRARDLALAGGTLLCVLIGFAPWIPTLLGHLEVTGQVSYYFTGTAPLAEWPKYIGNLLHTFALAEARTGAIAQPLLWAIMALGAISVLLAVRSFGVRTPDTGAAGDTPTAPTARTPRDTSAVSVWWCALALPLMTGVTDIARGTLTTFIAKYSFTFFPFLVLLAVRGWFGLSSAAARVAGPACWAAVLIAASASQQYATRTSDTDFEAVARRASAHDDSSHLVVLSSIRRGQGIPLLLSLREMGVRRVRIALAPRAQLLPLVRAACRDPQLTRITLVNLVVNKQEQTETWYARQIQEVRNEARAAGWGVWSGPPRQESRVFGPDDRIVTITSPTYPKVFAR